MFFDRPSSVEGPSKHFHPGSPRIKASLGPGCSGVIRDGPCWVRLWCDLGFRAIQSNPSFGSPLVPPWEASCINREKVMKPFFEKIASSKEPNLTFLTF